MPGGSLNDEVLRNRLKEAKGHWHGGDPRGDHRRSEERQYGKQPQHLVFDSKLTTYQGLDRLDAAGITFLTLRRRSPGLIAEVDRLPPSAWRTITLDVPHRKYRKPRVFEQKARPRERTYRQFYRSRSR